MCIFNICDVKNYFSSKSVKLGFMPMAKELAKRGHKVFMVSPHKGKNKHLD